MIRYLARRLALAVLVALTVLTALASFARVLPGDAATVMLGSAPTPELVATVREEMGLDEPVPGAGGGFVSAPSRAISARTSSPAVRSPTS